MAKTAVKKLVVLRDEVTGRYNYCQKKEFDAAKKQPGYSWVSIGSAENDIEADKIIQKAAAKK